MTFARWRTWARDVKRDVIAVSLAARDPRVPVVAQLLAVLVAAYALSPIDLIPDFIPVFGYVDDLLIVPLGILLVVRMIPDHVMAEHRAAATKLADKPRSTVAAVVIVGVWIVVTVAAGMWVFRWARW